MAINKSNLNEQLIGLNLQDIIKIASRLPDSKREDFFKIVNEQYGADFLKKLKKGEI